MYGICLGVSLIDVFRECVLLYLQMFQIFANIVIFVVENNLKHDRISS